MTTGAQQVMSQKAGKTTQYKREEEPIDLLRSLSREEPIRARVRVRVGQWVQ